MLQKGEEMKKFSIIGVCAMTLILVASLAIPIAAQDNECTHISYVYDGSTVPEKFGEWEPFRETKVPKEVVDWYSEEGMFHNCVCFQVMPN